MSITSYLGNIYLSLDALLKASAKRCDAIVGDGEFCG